MANTNPKQYNDPWERDYYGTGSTQPPKDRGGLIAILLVAVILLGGTCSALGIINLHLLRQLAQQQEPLGTLNVFDSAQDHSYPTPIGESADSIPFARLGLEGQTVSDFDRRFYDLPQGVLITEVWDHSAAHEAGLHTGDVLVTIGTQTVISQEDLVAAIEASPAGTPIEVEFYRHQTGQKMQTTIKLPEE